MKSPSADTAKPRYKITFLNALSKNNSRYSNNEDIDEIYYFDFSSII